MSDDIFYRPPPPSFFTPPVAPFSPRLSQGRRNLGIKAAALVADLGDGPLWEDLLEEVEPRPDKNDRGPLVPTHTDENGDRRFGTAGPDRHYGLPFGGRPRE